VSFFLFRLVETLEVSTPQGLEVIEWLALKMLSPYTHTFARNKAKKQKCSRPIHTPLHATRQKKKMLSPYTHTFARNKASRSCIEQHV